MHYQSKVWTHLLMQFFFLTLQFLTLKIYDEDIIYMRKITYARKKNTVNSSKYTFYETGLF